MSELKGFRVAVLATDGFEESELTEPVKALRDAVAEVTIPVARGRSDRITSQPERHVCLDLA